LVTFFSRLTYLFRIDVVVGEAGHNHSVFQAQDYNARITKQV
jgi:hypothetical protein